MKYRYLRDAVTALGGVNWKEIDSLEIADHNNFYHQLSLIGVVDGRNNTVGFVCQDYIVPIGEVFGTFAFDILSGGVKDWNILKESYNKSGLVD